MTTLRLKHYISPGFKTVDLARVAGGWVRFGFFRTAFAKVSAPGETGLRGSVQCAHSVSSTCAGAGIRLQTRRRLRAARAYPDYFSLELHGPGICSLNVSPTLGDGFSVLEYSDGLLPLATLTSPNATY